MSRSFLPPEGSAVPDMPLKSNCRTTRPSNRQCQMAGTCKRIAIVDDDASVRRALDRLLRAFAFETQTYGSGPEFLAAVHGFRPDCVILDLHMEGMNGLDVQRHLTRVGSHAAIIMISGHDNAQARAESLSLGAEAFLSKPVDGQLLISTVEKLAGSVI
jgi:FixJ family two-component response regulator